MPFSTKIFESGFETIPVGGSNPEFNQAPTGAGESVTINGRGLVGKSLRVQVQDADSQCGVTKALTAPSKLIEYWYCLDNSNNLAQNNGKLIFKSWSNTNFTGDLAGIMIRKTSSNTVQFGITSNTSTFADSAFETTTRSLTTVSAGANQQNTWFKLVISLHETGKIHLFVDGAILPSLTINATGYTSATSIQSFILGKFFQGNTGWGNTVMYYDNLRVYDNYYLQTTEAGRAKASAYGFLQRYVSSEGCVVRYPDSEAKADTYFGGPRKVDSCSEGQAYGLMLAVELGEKAMFDTIESYNYNVFDRRNRGASGAPNFMAWIHDPTKADSGNNTDRFPDEAFAIDADADRCMALLWADAVWGSSGTINYKQRAITIGRDILSICTYQATNNLLYLLSGGNAGTLNLQNGFNVSYFQNYLFFKLKQIDTTNSVKYQQLIDGSNDFLNKVSDTGGGLPTPVGLYPNWAGWNPSVNDVTVAPEGWMDGNYTYDAIRTPLRSYMSYLWYNDLPNKTRMEGNLYTFMASQWNNGSGEIKAEYFQNGGVKGNYQSVMMYSLNSWIFKIKGDNTNYNLILNTKVRTTYKDSPAGDVYGYYTGLQANGYFGSFWNAWTTMLDTNQITDFGAAVNPPLTPSDKYYRACAYPELNTGKIRNYL